MKILFSATVVKTHINTFHQPFLKLCKEMGWETAVCAKNDFENKDDCKIQWCDKYYDMPFERFPFKLKNIKVFLELRKLIKKEKYDIIHCHTPSAGVITRLAAAMSGVKKVKVIYTAHGFHFFKGSPLINWLVYFPVEWICAFMTDVLITINDEDYRLAKKCMHAKKVEYMHGVGIDLEKKFCRSVLSKKEMRDNLKLSEDKYIILSVGEININKNHETVIKAIKKTGLDNIEYVIAGRGPLENRLKAVAEEEGILHKVNFVGFRNNINEFLQAADLFCFPSYREGLSAALMEAMASSVPVIASDIRGNRDLIDDGKGGYLVKPDDVEGFAEKITELYTDSEKCKKFAEYSCNKVKDFDIKVAVEELKKIYNSII